jgi:hypothetical protein
MLEEVEEVGADGVADLANLLGGFGYGPEGEQFLKSPSDLGPELSFLVDEGGVGLGGGQNGSFDDVGRLGPGVAGLGLAPVGNAEECLSGANKEAVGAGDLLYSLEEWLEQGALADGGGGGVVVRVRFGFGSDGFSVVPGNGTSFVRALGENGGGWKDGGDQNLPWSGRNGGMDEAMGLELGSKVDPAGWDQGNKLGADNEEVDVGMGFGGVESGVDTWGHVYDGLYFVE